MITVRERHAEWYCAIRPETAILGASPPGGPALSGGAGLVGGEHHDDQYREDPGDPRRPDRSSVHSRHAWMSVTRMARAPTSYSSSMIRCTSVRATIAWTATQPSRCSGEIVGDSMPGVSAQAASTWSART